MNEVYKLPQLPPAPTSELQLLLRRWFTHCDFSTVPAILDELQEQGRMEDRRQLLRMFADKSFPTNTPYWASPFPVPYLPLFWWDLFDLNSQLQSLQEHVLKSIPNPKADLMKAIGNISPQRFIAAMPAQAGEMTFVVSPAVAEALVNSGNFDSSVGVAEAVEDDTYAPEEEE